VVLNGGHVAEIGFIIYDELRSITVCETTAVVETVVIWIGEEKAIFLRRRTLD